jgi:peptide/nickel transport system permease protein
MFGLGKPSRNLKNEKLSQQAARIREILGQMPAVPLFILFTLIVIAISAGWIAPHSPVEGSLRITMLPPAWMEGGNSKYLLGTDRFGRDVLSRLIYGARVSMSVAFLAIAVTAAIGTLIGLIAGYLGGRVDTVLMRLADIGLSMPGILIALILAVVLGPSFRNVILIVLIVLWPQFARQVRGEALSIKEQDFVILAKSMGVSSWKIMWRHIFPNVTPSLLVLATLNVGYVVILEATLAFLGVGIPPPNPSWGVMISEGREYLETAWWVSFFPGIAIGFTVFALNMTGDWVRDKLDPRLRQI